MKIEQFEVPGLAQYSYIVSSGDRAAVIDPMRDIERYVAYAAQHGLAIVYVLETHIHADFVSGATALAAATGATLALSAYDEDELYQYAMPHRPLHDGDSIDLGEGHIRALHTPGHTPEHLSFLVFDGSQPVALLSGDFLFVGSLGRPDLLGEAAKIGLAHELYQSLHRRIASLPDNIAVYPGHGAGSLCGSGMSELAESTLGHERANDLLFRWTEEVFVSEILGSVPPMPRYYPRMKRWNAAGAPALPKLPGGTALSVAEVKALTERNDTIVLDVRRAEAFGGAHLAGAISIGAGQNLSLWAGWVLDAEKQIVLVGDGGDEEAARRFLIQVGLDNITGYLKGGMAAWLDAGGDFARTKQVSASEVQSRSPETVMLDVRTDTEWTAGHIVGAQHIVLGDLIERICEVPRDRPIVTVCGSGYRSSIAASLLQQHGFTEISSLAGGMNAWQMQQMPLSH